MAEKNQDESIDLDDEQKNILNCMYPLCKDCIHKHSVCTKFHVSISQTRKNERLCGESARFFSPRFASIKPLRIWEHDIKIK